MTSITVHVLSPSHPCLAVEAALQLKGLEYERIALQPGEHVEKMAAIYGEGKTTVPGMVVDEEPVHGSRAIYEKLDTLVAEPALLATGVVQEAEAWGDRELQDLGRRLPWGAMHFRPEAMGTFGGAEPLDPPGTDFALKHIRALWKYHGISAVQLAEDLTGLPEKLDHVDCLIAEGVIGGEQPNAADLQIASTLRILLCLDDLAPLMTERQLEELARRRFPDYPGRVPAGAFPAGWVPERG